MLCCTWALAAWCGALGALRAEDSIKAAGADGAKDLRAREEKVKAMVVLMVEGLAMEMVVVKDLEMVVVKDLEMAVGLVMV